MPGLLRLARPVPTFTWWDETVGCSTLSCERLPTQDFVWPSSRTGGATRASAFFLPGMGALPGMGGGDPPGIDDDPRPEWPNHFFPGQKRGLARKLINNMMSAMGLDLSGDDSPWQPGPADLGPYVRKVHREAVKADRAATAAEKAAELAFARDRGLAVVAADADRDWHGAVHAAKVGAAQRAVDEALKGLEANLSRVSGLIRQGVVKVQQAPSDDAFRREQDMAKAWQSFKWADNAFPQVREELSKVNAAQVQLDRTAQGDEGLGHHALFPVGGLPITGGPLPPADPAGIDQGGGPVGPEVEIKALEPAAQEAEHGDEEGDGGGFLGGLF